MKKTLILLFIFFVFVWNAYAAPSISGVSGTVEHGQNIVITGSDFGSKATAAPLVWDNFEWGSDTDGITTSTGYTYTYDGSREPEIDTAQDYGPGSRSVYNIMYQNGSEATEFRPFYHAFTGQTKAYLSVMARWSSSGTATGMWKSPRLIGGGAYYDTGPGLSWTAFYNSSPTYCYYYNNSGDFTCQYGTPTFYKTADRETWIRLEFYLEASTPGSADGKAQFWIDLVRDNRGYNAVMTRAAGINNLITSFSSGHMFVNGTANQEHYLWIDDVYVDNTLARVEIGNNSVFASCTHREIQVPSAWSTTSATAEINQGSFTNDATAYLFVIDSDGAVSGGHEITFGSGSETSLSIGGSQTTTIHGTLTIH